MQSRLANLFLIMMLFSIGIVNAVSWNISNELVKPLSADVYFDSQQTSFEGLKAFDNLNTSKWLSQYATDGHYIYVDLGNVTYMQSFWMQSRDKADNVCLGSWHLDISNVTSSWTQWSGEYVTSGTGACSGQTSQNYYEFNNFTIFARYIRVYVTTSRSDAANYETAIQEIGLTKKGIGGASFVYPTPNNFITVNSNFVINCSATDYASGYQYSIFLDAVPFLVNETSNEAYYNITTNYSTQGGHYYSCQVSNTTSGESSQVITNNVTIDTDSPLIVDIQTINNNTLFLQGYGMNFSANITFSNTNLNHSAVFLDDILVINQTVLEPTTYTHNWSYLVSNLSVGSHVFVYKVIDDGFLVAQTNFTFYLANVSTKYNLTTLTDTNQTYILNVTLPAGWNVSLTSFLYNNKNMSFVRNNSVFITEYHLIETAGTYYLNYSLNFSSNLTNKRYDNITFLQTVSGIVLTSCSAGSANLSLILDIYNEKPLGSTNASLKLTLNPYLLSEEITTNYSFTLSGSNKYYICMSPYTSEPTYINGLFEISKPEYNTRNYYIRGYILDNNTKNLSLYTINSTQASVIVISVQDNDGSYVSNALLQAYRYYPEDGKWRLVESALTNPNGEAALNLVAFDSYYRFAVIKNGEVLYTESTAGRQITQSTFTLPISTQNGLLQEYNDIQGVDANLFYNNDTHTYTFTYNDPTGTTSQACLETRFDSDRRGTTIYCSQDNCASGSSGIIYCTISQDNQSGVYSAIPLIRTYSGKTIPLRPNIMEYTPVPFEGLQNYVAFAAAFFYVPTILSAIFNPVMALGMLILSAFILFKIGIFVWTELAMATLLVLAIYFIKKLRT